MDIRKSNHEPKLLTLSRGSAGWLGSFTSRCSGKEIALLPRTVRQRSSRSFPELTAGRVDLALSISTNKKSACLHRAGCINYLLVVAKKLCDMKSDCVSETSNQIPSPDEIMPYLNHSGIYNTQNGQQTLCVRIHI